MNFSSVFLISAITIIISCNASKPVFDPETTKEDYLAFGNGGGFTGKGLKYYLTKDGNVYTRKSEISEKAGKVPKSVCAQIFSNYTLLSLDKISLNEPGNKFYFIEFSSKNVKNSIKWGKSPMENSNLETFYKVLMNTVKDLK